MDFIRIVALVACGAGLAACSSGSGLDLGLDLFTAKAPLATLTIESSPPGAEARTSLGGTCRTPCALPVEAAGDFTVSYALNGYLPQTVTVHPSVPGGGFLSLSTPSPICKPIRPWPPSSRCRRR